MEDFDEVSRRDHERAERRRRRRERLIPVDEEEETRTRPLNRDWRSQRARDQRATGALRSPQEFQLWLQKGGWLVFAGIATLVVIVLVFLLVNRDTQALQEEFSGEPPQGEVTLGEQDDSMVVVDETGEQSEVVLPAQPSVTPAPATAAGNSRAFEVVNTGGLGLFLRAEPNPDSEVLATLPDGTRVEPTDTEETTGSQYVWRQVRTAEGQEGWVAVDFLREVAE